MKIGELKPKENVDLIFKVLEKNEERMTRSGNRVAEALVGDETGVVIMTLWENDIDKIEEGKTYNLKNGYVTLFKGSMRLTIGRSGSVEEAEEEIEEVNKDNNVSDKTFPDVRRYQRRSYRVRY
jgi:replication factor A1